MLTQIWRSGKNHKILWQSSWSAGGPLYPGPTRWNSRTRPRLGTSSSQQTPVSVILHLPDHSADSDTALRAIRQGTHRQNKLVTCHIAHVVRAHPKAITTLRKGVISLNMTEQVITACSLVSAISCVHKPQKQRRDLVMLFWSIALCIYRAARHIVTMFRHATRYQPQYSIV
jgi:hypothetical protein